MKTIERIKELRAERGLSQANVAEYLAVTRQTYNRYETGAREIDISTLSKLADFYGVTADYILGRTDD